jgi:CheY-like chemotaxis protein
MATKLERSRGNELHVIVVEDNEHMRVLLRTVLNAMGIRRIIEFEEGSEALKKFAALKPDFVLTDLSMAPMDGLHFTRAIRQMPEQSLCVTPIIMVTGHTERRRVEAARDAGVNEILAKPITPAGLFSRVEEIVYRPRPFVRSPNYCGPCRRRQDKPDYVGPWRRESDTDLRDMSSEATVTPTEGAGEAVKERGPEINEPAAAAS